MKEQPKGGAVACWLERVTSSKVSIGGIIKKKKKRKRKGKKEGKRKRKREKKGWREKN